MKKFIEVHQNTFNKAKGKTDILKEIRDMLENLKIKGLIKSQLVLDVVDDENFKLLQDNKNTNNQDKSAIEKDDIER